MGWTAWSLTLYVSVTFLAPVKSNQEAISFLWRTSQMVPVYMEPGPDEDIISWTNPKLKNMTTPNILSIPVQVGTAAPDVSSLPYDWSTVATQHETMGHLLLVHERVTIASAVCIDAQEHPKVRTVCSEFQNHPLV